MSSMLFALVGLPGCGKSTAADYFKKNGLPIIRMGDVTDDLLKKDQVTINEENEKKYREYIRVKYGKDIYAKLTAPKISSVLKYKSIVIIDGLRSIEEFDYFKEKYPNIKVLYIETSRSIRYQRLKHRLIRSLSITEAKKRDRDEISFFQLTDFKKIAEYIIKNEGSIQHFNKQLDTLMLKFQR